MTFPIVAASARGATLTDVDGNTFIDFAGGVGCLNVGHGHRTSSRPRTSSSTASRHTDFTIVPYEPYVDARRAARRVGADLGARQGRVLQRRHRGGRERRQVRARLHGPPGGRSRSTARSTAGRCSRSRSPRRCTRTRPGSGRSRPRSTACRSRTRTAASRPRTRSPRSSARSRPSSRRRPSPRSSSSRFRARAASSSRRRSSSPECAASATARHRARRRRGADRASAAPGRFFAIEHSGVEPDLICVAKSIASGLPLSGVLGRAEIMDAPVVGGVGGTYVGNPVAQAAALAVLDVIDDEGLVERSARDRRDDPAAHARLAGALARDRRRPRPRLDARDRARLRPGDAEARRRSSRSAVTDGGARARPAADHLRRLRQLHSRARAARDRRRGARGGARRLGRGARGRARLAALRRGTIARR